MQVRLTTTVTTIIDLEESGASFEEARREIFHRFNEETDLDDSECTDEIKSAHAKAVVFDTVRLQSVEHSFEEVK